MCVCVRFKRAKIPSIEFNLEENKKETRRRDAFHLINSIFIKTKSTTKTKKKENKH